MREQIAFLASVAPIFSKFLKKFQAEGPLVHILFAEMKETEEMAFDLHQWFKSSPCKHEDFLKLEENTQLDSSLLCGIFQENASQTFYQQSKAQKDCWTVMFVTRVCVKNSSQVTL